VKNNSTRHYLFLDFLKTIAANLIVLHHLAYYGPMSDYVKPVLPELIELLQNHARIAVQIFLVIGGFLAAKSLSPQGRPSLTAPLRAVLRRFLKLMPPFMVAMLLAVAASALARMWMTHDSISAPPTLAQLWAHAFLLHSVLNVESLSAGVWYVAIDFQLYALLTLLLWLSGRLANGRPTLALVPMLVGSTVTASLFYFNLDAEWDVWAPYFFGSYGLGALAWWTVAARKRVDATLLMGSMLLLGGLALEMEFRSRIALALATAILLVVAYRGETKFSMRQWPALKVFGRISYALFLVHFPVCLVVNAAFTRFMPHTLEVQAIGMLYAWAACIVAGVAFHHWVEVPLGRLLSIGDTRSNTAEATPLAS
jgi:peptidoglycan/LPS O-acetylase OafA/YrhL